MAVFGHREDKSKVDLLEFMYPVGSIYMSVNPTNPTNLFGGTWVAWGNGRVPVGVNTSDSEFSTVEKTGGAKSVTLTAAQSGVSAHTHSIPKLSGTANARKTFVANTGGQIWGTNESTDYSSEMGFAEGDLDEGTTKIPFASRFASVQIKPLANHTHPVETSASTSGNNTAKDATSAHTNLQPYITCYMWKRTA